ncbi:zinc-dependent alcohol dehydrogenase family protein, partial [Streptomyces sp. NPDC047072]|uniref:zinc-dependent alcohol dehydrogenase family protein n=1 Tax=Streptomyces sp. NPDC047072 TaxID=3154809 RepID=UPI0033E83A45
MRGAVIHAPGDVRFEEVDDAKIVRPTDAVIRTAVTCVCGSDLWPYRGAEPVDQPHPMGHEYVGVVEEVGSEVTHVKPGQFVIGSFATSDNTCVNCRAGYQSNCVNREFMSTCQAEYVRIPNAHGTLVATPEHPGENLWPSLLALSDVMGTGWWAAKAAEVRPGSTAVVVGDGAVGLCGVIAAKELGAERIIAMSRHASRQKLALEFGATDIVTERGEEGIARVKDLTDGVGADSVLECVGTAQSMQQALHATRPGGNVGFVGVPHDVAVDGQELFFSHVGLRGGPAPVRGYLPDLIARVFDGR